MMHSIQPTHLFTTCSRGCHEAVREKKTTMSKLKPKPFVQTRQYRQRHLACAEAKESRDSPARWANYQNSYIQNRNMAPTNFSCILMSFENSTKPNRSRLMNDGDTGGTRGRMSGQRTLVPSTMLLYCNVSCQFARCPWTFSLILPLPLSSLPLCTGNTHQQSCHAH
jgi:hypothetical protein